MRTSLLLAAVDLAFVGAACSSDDSGDASTADGVATVEEPSATTSPEP